MTNLLRVGIVGCGNIAGNHLTAFRAAPGVDVVACCDVDPERAAGFATRHGVPAAVPDVEALLDLGVDVVSVCTPHPTHEAVVTAAAARGAHVLCEKPIAIELASAARMIAACDAAGVTLGVLFQRRFWPAAQRIRAAIDDGTLGTPFLGHASVLLHRDTSYYTADPWRGTWATDGGGVLMTQAVHNIDLLAWFMGECVEVSAAHATVKHGAAIEVEDTAVATLRFASGGLATLAASTALTPGLGTRVQRDRDDRRHGRAGRVPGGLRSGQRRLGGARVRLEGRPIPVRDRAARRHLAGRDQRQPGAVPRAADRRVRRRRARGSRACRHRP